MTTDLQFLDASTFTTPLLVVFAVDTATTDNKVTRPTLCLADPTIDATVQPFLNSAGFNSELGEILLLHAPQGVAAERLLIVGMGKASRFDRLRVRQAAGTAVRTAMSKGLRTLAVALPTTTIEPLFSNLGASRAIAEGLLLGAVDLDVYKTDRKDRTPESVTVLGLPNCTADERTGMRQGFNEGLLLAEAQNFARILVNEPGNLLPPTELARRTAQMAARVGLGCEVHSTDKLRELGMGAFLGVAQGSEQPPALIVLRYEPAEPPADGAPLLGLVGKGITFDTGGISIKPADGMEKMKNDMGGAAAVIGAMQAIAALKPQVRVLAVICSAENMPDGKAYRPGDVLTAMSGKTIEVMNTDAEGRLVLADGLHYATTLGATHLLDAATLTGACVVALGRVNAGLFANEETTCDRFVAAARTAGECFWCKIG